MHTALFFVSLLLLFFIIYMIHYSIIQKEVRKRSRCLRAKHSYAAGGQYEMKAVHEDGTDLYKLSYNMPKKEVKHECICPEGDTINTFKDIKYYDLKTASDRKIEKMMCHCDKAYDNISDDIFYDGHPGLVRYQQNSDGSFFVTDLSGSIASKIK